MTVRAVSLALLGLGLAIGSATAQDVCVACTGPSKTYRCQIAGADSAAAIKRSEKFAQVLCIADLAKRGGHETCSVKRDGFSNCLGDIAVVSASQAAGLTEFSQPVSTGAGTVERKEGVPEGQKAASPPATVVELAKRTGEASKQQLDKTGAAVGGAMKKTWGCVTSLFTSCW